MSIQAKQNLTADVETQIGDFLTVTNTKKVVAVLNDTLTNYDVDEIKDPEISLDLLEQFLKAKAVEGRSERTINRYSYMLEKMLKAIGIPAEKITTAHLRQYFMEEKQRGLSDQSLEGLRSICNSFFGWSVKEDLISKNPCANVGPIKCQKKIRLPFTAVDIEKLKDGCTNIRDKAIICFLLSTGARISEVCALNVSDIDFRRLECKVLGKGNKERTVYMDEVTAMTLQEYLTGRTDSESELFHGPLGRITPQGMRAMLKRLEERTGVENVHPHRFRRTLATTLINHGMPIQEVAAVLGHDKLDTTLKYVYINDTNVKNSYRRYM